MILNDLVIRISEGIAEMEGFYKAGSLPQRLNNPGDLRKWGKTPVVVVDKRGGTLCNFPTLAEGWNALRRQVEKNVGRGLTLYEFFGGKPNVYPGYAPDSDGNRSRHYAEFVAKRVKIPADVPLNKLYQRRESQAQREE